MLCVRIDPEAVVKLRIAHRDMPRYALGKPEAREDAKRRSEFEFAMLALFLKACEYRRLRQTSANRFGNPQLADVRMTHNVLLRAVRALIFFRPEVTVHRRFLTRLRLAVTTGKRLHAAYFDLVRDR